MSRCGWINASSQVILFAAALGLYTWTMNPDVQPADSGELQIAAIKLGIPHPPGYPLYTMLGWLFTRIPFSTPFARVTFLSVIVSALTLVLVSLAVQIIVNTESSAPAGHTRPIPLVSGLLGALVLGGSTTFWAQATTTNIRSLTAFFAALMLYAVVRLYARWGHKSIHSNGDTGSLSGSGRPSAVSSAIILYAVALGLGVGHHASLVFIGAIWSVWAILMLIHVHPTRKTVILAAVAFLSTQLVWIYLPLRDSVGARFAPGNLTTLGGLLYHIFARGFAGDMLAFAAPQYLPDRLSVLPTLFGFEFSWPLLLGALIGALVLLWKHRQAGVALVLAFVLHLFITITYRAPQTVEYALPAWVILCVLLGAGVGTLMQELSRVVATTPHLNRWSVVRSSLSIGGPAILVLGLSLLAIRDGVNRWPSFVNLANDRSTRQNATQVLQGAAPDSTVLAEWHQATAMWALQDIERLRTDVHVQYVYPQGAQAYADTFAGQASASVLKGTTYVTSYFAPSFQARGLAVIPNTVGWQVLASPVITHGAGTQNDFVFGRQILVYPLRILSPDVMVGQALNVIVTWRAAEPLLANESLTVRIMRANGQLASNADIQLDPAVPASEVSARKITLGIPLDLSPGTYTLLIGAYQTRQSAFAALKERSGEDFVSAGVVRVIPTNQRPVTCHPMDMRFISGAKLVGVDYDTGVVGRLRLITHWQLATRSITVTVQDTRNTPLAAPQVLPASQDAGAFFNLIFDLPPTLGVELATTGEQEPVRLPDASSGERYIPFADQMVLVGSSAVREGGQLKVDLRWLSARAITTDYIVSARVDGAGAASFHAAYDGVPALGMLPTLKWIRGSLVTDRHPIELNGYSGALRGTVVVYDSFTQQELPSLDERYESGISFPVP